MKNIKLSQDFSGSVRVSLQLTNKTDIQALQELTGIDLLDVTIKKHRNKRSLTANSYMWVLLDKMAQKLQTTKSELYVHAIKQVGKFDHVPILEDAVIDFLKAWQGDGIGNIGEVLRDATIPGYKLIRIYYGSSTYNSEEMARLIDYIVTEAKELGIDTMSIANIERLK